METGGLHTSFISFYVHFSNPTFNLTAMPLIINITLRTIHFLYFHLSYFCREQSRIRGCVPVALARKLTFRLFTLWSHFALFFG